MTPPAHSPQAFEQMKRNARDYRIGVILDEIDHGANAFDLQKRRHSDDDIKAAFARIDAAAEARHKQAREVGK